jgi:glutaredoxin
VVSSRSADESRGSGENAVGTDDLNGRETHKGLALYQTAYCPYCVRVRRALDALGVEIEVRDIAEDSERYRELVEATGRQTVPVLRIEEDDGQVSWLPESAEIIDYLEERFHAA